KARLAQIGGPAGRAWIAAPVAIDAVAKLTVRLVAEQAFAEGHVLGSRRAGTKDDDRRHDDKVTNLHERVPEAGRHHGYENSRPLSQSEHKQHGLVAHFPKFRRIYQRALGDPAKPRQDCNILLAADLEGHGRRIDADTDIDLPKLLKADVVIGRERSIDQAREQEAAGRREGCAAVGIRFAHLLLHLTGEWIDNDDVGFGALDVLRHAARHRPGSTSARMSGSSVASLHIESDGT